MLDFKSLGDLLDLKKWFCTYKMVRSGLCIFIWLWHLKLNFLVTGNVIVIAHFLLVKRANYYDLVLLLVLSLLDFKFLACSKIENI